MSPKQHSQSTERTNRNMLITQQLITVSKQVTECRNNIEGKMTIKKSQYSTQ